MKLTKLSAAVVAASGLAACNVALEPDSDPSVSVTPTSSTPTVTQSATPTELIEPSISATPTVTQSATPTELIEPSISVTPTVTQSATPTELLEPSISATPTVTQSATPTELIEPSISVTPTVTQSVTPTELLEPSISATPTVTSTVTSTPSPSPTVFPTIACQSGYQSVQLPDGSWACEWFDATQTPIPSPTMTVIPSPSLTSSMTPTIVPVECSGEVILKEESYRNLEVAVNGRLNFESELYTEQQLPIYSENYSVLTAPKLGQLIGKEYQAGTQAGYDNFSYKFVGDVASDPVPGCESDTTIYEETIYFVMNVSATPIPSVTPSVISSVTPSVVVSPSVTPSVHPSVTITPTLPVIVPETAVTKTFEGWSLLLNSNIVCEDDLSMCADISLQDGDQLVLNLNYKTVSSSNMLAPEDWDIQYSSTPVTLSDIDNLTEVVRTLVTSSADFTTWKNDLPAAYAMQHDDWCGGIAPSILNHVYPEVTSRGLTSSIGIIAANCTEAEWSQARDMVNAGFSIFNHSMTHAFVNAPSWNPDMVIDWNPEVELNDANILITENTGFTPTYHGIPYGQWTTAAWEYMRAHPTLNKMRAPGELDGSWTQSNGINAANFADPYQILGNLYDDDWSPYNKANDGATKITSYLDATINAGGFGLQYFHGVNDSSYHSVPLEEFKQFLDHLQAKVAEKQVWADHAETIIDYRMAREHCDVSIQNAPFGYIVSFDESAKECKDYATELTLELSIDANVAAVIQNGESIAMVAKDSSIQMNVDPLAGELVVVLASDGVSVTAVPSIIPSTIPSHTPSPTPSITVTPTVTPSTEVYPCPIVMPTLAPATVVQASIRKNGSYTFTNSMTGWDSQTFNLSKDPAHGDVTLVMSGDSTYQAHQDFVGTDTFSTYAYGEIEHSDEEWSVGINCPSGLWQETIKIDYHITVMSDDVTPSITPSPTNIPTTAPCGMLPPAYVSGTHYQTGDEVSFEGRVYQCKSGAHCSIEGWDPVSAWHYWDTLELLNCAVDTTPTFTVTTTITPTVTALPTVISTYITTVTPTPSVSITPTPDLTTYAQAKSWHLKVDGNEVCSDHFSTSVSGCVDSVADASSIELDVTYDDNSQANFDLMSGNTPRTLQGSIHQVAAQASNATWKNDATGAWSLQQDDWCGWVTSGIYADAVPVLVERGLKASIGLIAGNCTEYPLWIQARDMLAQGMTMFNHSMNHNPAIAPSWDTNTVINWDNTVEMHDSNDVIFENINHRPSMFAFPNDLGTTAAINYLRDSQQYKGARGPNELDGGWVNTGGVNAANFDDPYMLKSDLYSEYSAYWSLGKGKRLTQYVDDAIAQGGWAFQYMHGVNDSSWFSVPKDEFIIMADYVKAKVDSNEIWSDTPETVLDYRFAREYCAPQTPKAMPFGWYIGVDNGSETCALYHTEVTAKVTLTSTVQVVDVLQNGTTLSFEFDQHSGVLLFDYLPNNGDLIVLTNEVVL